MMTQTELEAVATKFLEAWNSQDVEAVVACYTPDVVYRDPNTRGEVAGVDALRHYLTKLFAGWTMRWALREAFALAEGSGAAVLWRATFQRPGRDAVVEVEGMDLVVLEGQKICRNEVYFDRTLLAPLMATA